jgi:hypothetical protein
MLTSIISSQQRTDARFRRISDAARIALTIQLAIVLGMVNRLLLLAVAAVVPVAAPAPEIFELFSRISWSLLVCGSLGIVATLAKWRGVEMGVAGLLGAPLAFDLARAVRKGSVGYLQFVEATGHPAPVTLGLVKAVEYACLGVLLGRLASSGQLRARMCVLVGLLIGAVFGGIILMFQTEAEPLTWGIAAPWLVNEILFPIGCSLVLFLVENVVDRWEQPISATSLG